MSAIRSSLYLFTAVIVLSLVVGCGGGGGASASIKGILTDGFGAVINHPSAVITLVGTGETASPGANGGFQLTASPGSYVLRATFLNQDAGIRLEGSQTVNLVDDQTLDVGTFAISFDNLDTAWDAYRQENYTTAESRFNLYLDNVRSGQASLGESSAYSGLGWTHGRGMNKPIQSAIDFNDAIAGWNGNIDAYAGLSGAELAHMKVDGGFHFNGALVAVNVAIDGAGDYTSAPSHDSINELDLQSYRTFLNLLNGNTSGARTEALAIKDQVLTGGSVAGSNAVEIVLAFTE